MSTTETEDEITVTQEMLDEGRLALLINDPFHPEGRCCSVDEAIEAVYRAMVRARRPHLVERREVTDAMRFAGAEVIRNAEAGWADYTAEEVFRAMLAAMSTHPVSPDDGDTGPTQSDAGSAR